MGIYSKTATPASVRRKANGLKFKKERSRIGAVKGIAPARDEEYLDFIRTLPCVVCWFRMYVEEFSGASFDIRHYIGFCEVHRVVPGCFFRNSNRQYTEASHHGVRGLRQKASDLGAIGLCGEEHHREGKFSTHKLQKKFFDYHRIDYGELRVALNAFYGRYKESL